MPDRCAHLEESSEAYTIGPNGKTSPAVVWLCGWAITHPASADKLLDVPRWLQRESLSGHLWREGDCLGCPGYTEAKDG